MSTLPRRQTLKLVAAAIVVGPSVTFARTVDAATRKRSGFGLKALDFTVKVDGIYDAVPGVVAVDLGTVAYPVKWESRQGKVKIWLASEDDAPELTLNFAKDRKRKMNEVKLAIAVSLFADEGKTPALTYHILDAVPHSISTDEGKRLLSFSIGGMEAKAHTIKWKESGNVVRLPRDRFKVEIEGISVAAGHSMSKAVYDWKEQKVIESVLDTSKGGIAWGGATKDRKATIEVKHATNEVKLAVTSYITADKHFSSVMLARKSDAVKISVRPQGEKQQDIHFLKAKLTSIQFPKLSVGSDALVTETLHFTLDSGPL
jgi:hypothetical protein